MLASHIVEPTRNEYRSQMCTKSGFALAAHVFLLIKIQFQFYRLFPLCICKVLCSLLPLCLIKQLRSKNNLFQCLFEDNKRGHFKENVSSQTPREVYKYTRANFPHLVVMKITFLKQKYFKCTNTQMLQFSMVEV